MRAASNNAWRKNRADLSSEMKIEHWPGYKFAVLEKILHSHFAAVFAREVVPCFEKIFTFPCLNDKSCTTPKRIAGEGAAQ